jgi:hypothetical protein
MARTKLGSSWPDDQLGENGEHEVRTKQICVELYPFLVSRTPQAVANCSGLVNKTCKSAEKKIHTFIGQMANCHPKN